MRHKKTNNVRRNRWLSLLTIAAIAGNCTAAAAGMTDTKTELMTAASIDLAYRPSALPVTAIFQALKNLPAVSSAVTDGFSTYSAMATIAQTVDPIKTSSIPSSFFGTVAVPFAAINVRNQWDRVRSQKLPQADECTSKSCKSRANSFRDAVTRGKQKDFAGKLALANSVANSIIVYQSDREIYGRFDYWASAKETIQRGAGDCEDFAILKQTLLRAMGVPDKSLSIIILRDNSRNLYHAVLGVSTNQGHLILDNVRGQVFRDTQVSNYQPLFSFSGSRSWIHGRPAGNSTYSAKADIPLDNVAPGESAAMPVIAASVQPLVLSDLRPTLQY